MSEYLELRGRNIDTTTRNYQTYTILCKLFKFFECYWEDMLSEALREIAETGLLPIGNLNEQEMFEQISIKTAQARTLDAVILRNFADILLCTMDILHREYMGLKASVLSDKAQV
jgi:hypothetical protein